MIGEDKRDAAFMLIVRTNEHSYWKSLLFVVWRFFAYWDVNEQTEEETKSLLLPKTHTPYIWQSVSPQPLMYEEILCTDDEEEGVDRLLGNQMRRELCDITEHHHFTKLI